MHYMVEFAEDGGFPVTVLENNLDRDTPDYVVWSSDYDEDGALSAMLFGLDRNLWESAVLGYLADKGLIQA